MDSARVGNDGMRSLDSRRDGKKHQDSILVFLPENNKDSLALYCGPDIRLCVWLRSRLTRPLYC